MGRESIVGIRSFVVGAVIGAGSFWAVSNGHHHYVIDFVQDKLGNDAEKPAEDKPQPAAEPSEPVAEEREAEPAPAPPAEIESAVTSSFSGRASYYAESLDGNPTASGEPYDHGALTAAHPDLPFGTMVRVTNVETGASVVVRINDRGPYADDRVIDVSGAAAEELGMIQAGVIDVEVEVLA